ncbi:hypothetical protein LTR12_013138 [Friedmanniomyces endolithicus]|nr:hypothetical protein LTR74_002039 [Friedmanniomyces endolithicus]KAK1812497.1 hypothetical protein LTR12_013138 [Friedmanniomyces endolithicus]
MSSSTPTVNDLRASFEARSKPTNKITLARPPDISANKMFPAKLSPIKATIDTVLDTATSALKGTSTAPAPDPTPLATPNPPTDPGTSPAAAAATPTSSSASPAASPTVGSDPATAAAPPAVPNPPPPTPTTNAIPAAADTASAPPSTLASPKRPTASQRPTWIGPPRLVATTPAIMTYPATVKYTSKGLQPPVYIFTSLSDPQWEAVEMDHEILADGENGFSKTFMADEGEYQYKFRLGPGEWWALDDTKPTLDDGAGNKNNVMVVKPVTAAPQAPKQGAAKAVDAPAPQQPATISPPLQAAPALPAPQPAPQAAVSPPQQPPQILVDSTPVTAPLVPQEQPHPSDKSAVTPSNALRAVASAPITEAAPLLPHEQTPISEKPASTTINPLPTIASAVTSVVAPLMKHESFFADVKASSRYNEFDDDGDDDANLVEEDYDDDDEIFEHQQSPLMRHETLGPDSDEHAHSPLMRHESMTLYDRTDEPDHTYSRSYTAPLSLTTSSSSAADSVCPEADPNDPSLEKFPTDHVGIFQHIHRASTQLPADETEAVVNASSPLLVSREVSNSPSLPSVEEEDEEEEVQDLLREQERLYPHEKETQDDDADSLTAGLPTLMITEPSGAGLAALLTPPMTPQEAEKVIERAIEAAEVEKLDERIAAAEVAVAERERDGERSRKEGVVEAVQGGRLSSSPTILVGIAGIALAVAVGVWKLQYA